SSGYSALWPLRNPEGTRPLAKPTSSDFVSPDERRGWSRSTLQGHEGNPRLGESTQLVNIDRCPAAIRVARIEVDALGKRSSGPVEIERKPRIADWPRTDIVVA